MKNNKVALIARQYELHLVDFLLEKAIFTSNTAWKFIVSPEVCVWLKHAIGKCSLYWRADHEGDFLGS
jgi:hypothetical protein